MRTKNFLPTLSYLLVILSLTLLKSFFDIGGLWDPSRQRVRKIEPVPLDWLFESYNWQIHAAEKLGNVLLFVPLGLLLAMSTKSVRRATGLSFGFSVVIELWQYVLALGRTDPDDVICNTLGGLIGAWICLRAGPGLHPLWRFLGYAALPLLVALALWL